MQALGVVLIIAVIAAPTGAQPQMPSGIEVTGATFAEVDERSGVLTLRGAPVVLRRKAMVVRAASITYDTRGQIARATGGVQYEDDSLTLTGGALTVWVREDRFVAEGRVAVVQRGPDSVRVQAGRIEGFGRERRLVATGGPVVTSPDGTLEGERIEAVGQRDELTAEGSARIAHEDIEGRAAAVILRRRDGMAVLSGGAVVRQARSEARARTITVDLRRRRIIASGAASLTVQAGR